ncbi:MAG: hypothetical protein GX032_04225 [Tenericutes bacterium]|nr:hypothetical protein [Mycoplasmatota bacterium]
MREVELTIQLLDELDEVTKNVEEQGYELIQKYYIKDYYMIHKSVDLGLNNYSILKKCLLIREVKTDSTYKYLIYKNKEYDNNGKILSQNKVKINIDSISEVKKILELVDFHTLIEIENNSLVYKKDNIEFTIQKITDPKGLYIEMEANEEELKEKDDEIVKEVLKNKLNSLNLKTTGDYEVKKAFISLNKRRG